MHASRTAESALTWLPPAASLQIRVQSIGAQSEGRPMAMPGLQLWGKFCNTNTKPSVYGLQIEPLVTS